ncbi:MAG TPA: error-prone DNA polymerase, partial [Thermoanaerobaculia bacterium]|nr:error-prone DNA polymerase [Thermoanaerobaculia bacterium]
MSERSRREPVRDLGSGRPYLSPGARKEKLRERSFRRGPAAAAPLPWAELRSSSAFSFLDGASLPEDLVARAAELGLPAVALVDRNGVYGAPRFWKAAKGAGVRALVGAEVTLVPPGASRISGASEGASRISRKDGAGRPSGSSTSGTGPRNLPRGSSARTCASAARGPRAPAHDDSSAAPELPPVEDPEGRLQPRDGFFWLPRLSLLAENRTGYRNLCRLLTAAALGKPKGETCASWEEVAARAEGLHVLTGGDEGPVARAFARGGIDAARRALERLAHLFPGRVHVELQRHGRRAQERRNLALVELARRLGLPLVATNGTKFARAGDKPLFDVLTAIREHVPLDAAGSLLAPNRERHLKGAAEMARLFADLPAAVSGAWELSERLSFTLDDLGYRFPDFPLPPGETPASWLRKLAWNGARARFRPLTAKAQRQIAKELDLIEKLDLAGYFLIVGELVEFCRRGRILCQGRGSAANSAVCYALGITAVDPVRMELLFERFLSEERGEWPDIDLDLPSGDPREKVIQHVYATYGAPAGGAGAAMTANVITYRDRSAAREVAKALGYGPEQVDRLAKTLGSYRYDLERGDPRDLARELAEAGFDPAEPRNAHFATHFRRIQNLPRHLGQHSGGMVIAAGRLDEIVPLEPAAMPGRTVVQWDKDDCADLGIIKVDLLGLGMLNAIERVIPMVREKERVNLDLAHLPPDDPEVYAMLRAADTVGVFQVESRAQMASLPRNAPARFYDLVIQVAIIRPGPITGGMVHPFFERRLGREEVTYFHPCLEPILARTLGVPIFQEQLLRMAMAVAGFSGGEAEELRRAMGFKRSVERMQAIEARLRAGMAARGITGETQDRIVQSITSFALYGFPESHAASFALIAYASAYLKRHHPTAFLIGLLNAWPMGFYHPATLVKDAQRHGVEVRPIDVNFSDVECTWEETPKSAQPVRGQNARIEAGPLGEKVPSTEAPSRAQGPFPPGGGGQVSLANPRTGVPRRPEGGVPRARGACRIGLRYVEGLRRAAAEAIVAARRRGGPFPDADALARRTRLRADELERLASIGALATLGASRRGA